MTFPFDPLGLVDQAVGEAVRGVGDLAVTGSAKDRTTGEPVRPGLPSPDDRPESDFERFDGEPDRDHDPQDVAYWIGWTENER